MPRWLSILWVCLCVAHPAHADDVDVELSDIKALAGKGEPALTLHISRALTRLEVSLTGTQGTAVKKTLGKTKAGAVVRVPLPKTLGVTTYTGQLTVRFANAAVDVSMPLTFDIDVVASLAAEVVHESLDLAHGRVVVKLSRPAGRCDYNILLDGKQGRHGSQAFAGEPAQTPLTVELPVSADDVVLKVGLTCYDTDEFFIGVDLFPWKLEVPHEDVNFASGDASVAKSEQAKLDRAYDEIATALRRYGDMIKIRLFVVGHTDTVGDAGSNQALSVARARSIAAYLKKQGVRVPISYAGLGESSLAVETPDETSEEKNRRAQYILAVDEPMALSWSGL